MLPPVGFIGLGRMGSRMAVNLCKRGGFNILAVDTDTSKISDLSSEVSKAGSAGTLKQADSLAQLAAECPTILSMLPDTPDVESVYEKLIRTGNIGDGSLLIDSSTVDPVRTAALSKRILGETGASMMDAPVSGGIVAAAAGQLSFMAGGEAKDVDRARDILLATGKSFTHCGPNGTGAATKLCNNLAMGISMMAVSEAFALGTKLGLDMKILTGVFNESSARCWSSDTYNPVPGTLDNGALPSSNDYIPGFPVDLMLKDLKLALNSSEQSGAALPSGRLAFELYSQIDPTKDFSYIYQFMMHNNPK